VASELAHLAYKASQTTTGQTPFSRSCALNGYKGTRGGKQDDITVLVGQLL
jgi:hypothetical protein